LLSERGKDVFILINHVTLSSLFCLFGIAGNFINIRVFLKQGLKRSTNLSFFTMAVTDTLEIVFQIWHNVCLNPYLLHVDSSVDFYEIQYLTAGTPSVLLVRITGWITVYVTAERCLSIAAPLKIKQIVTPRRTAAILVFIYVMNYAGLIPIYFAAYFSWKLSPARNRTKLGMSFRDDVDQILSSTSSFHSGMTVTAFVLVIIFTSILVFFLKQKSKWRRASTAQAGQTGTVSSRERKTVFTVIVVAAVLIVCYTPGISFDFVTSINQDFSLTGKHANVFQAAWSFAFLLHSVNSSINVLLYYKTSTRYRQTVRGMFPRCFKNRGPSAKTNTANTTR
ncbi:unnamed protein product, partial [Lymnaea stagnalis]